MAHPVNQNLNSKLLVLSCQVRKCYYVHTNGQNKPLLLLSSTLTWVSNSRQATAVYFNPTQISGSKSTLAALTV